MMTNHRLVRVWSVGFVKKVSTNRCLAPKLQWLLSSAQLCAIVFKNNELTEDIDDSFCLKWMKREPKCQMARTECKEILRSSIANGKNSLCRVISLRFELWFHHILGV